MVSPEKQIWHDFSSGKGGDIFTFVMMVKEWIFVNRWSIWLGRRASDLVFNGDGRTAKRRARAREALKLAANFYQQNLVKIRQPKLCGKNGD